MDGEHKIEEKIYETEEWKHKHREFKYDNEVLELWELEHMVKTWGYEPQGLKYYHNGTLGTSNDMYEHRVLKHNDNNNACVLAPADLDAAELLTPSNTTYVPTHLVPVHTHPNTYHPIPAPTPHPHDISNVNQPGHMTMLKHAQDARELTCAEYNMHKVICANYNVAEPTVPE
jgi:hypothetical protein